MCRYNIMLTIYDLFTFFFSFFFNDTATPEIYTLSLHDALPILAPVIIQPVAVRFVRQIRGRETGRQSLRHTVRSEETRLNSSHVEISYAVFCLKKKNKVKRTYTYKRKTNRKLTAHSVIALIFST